MRGMAAKPKARPKGPWTAEEIAREERVDQNPRSDRPPEDSEQRLEETLRLSRFLQRAQAGRSRRCSSPMTCFSP